MLKLTSNITFLYFKDMVKAREFFESILALEVVYDPGWAVVYRLKADSFLGAVDASQGSIGVESHLGVLISLTVSDAEKIHHELSQKGLELSALKLVKDLPLKSFFFTGPEGYEFEIQEFTSAELKEIFSRD